MIPGMPILAQTNAAAESASRVTYEFSRLESFTDNRLYYVLLAGVCALVVALVIWLYRRDTVELRPGVAIALAFLRLGVFAAVLFFFLDLEKRSQREIVNNSRVLLLVDTSQSMGLHDAQGSAVPASPSRIDQVVEEFRSGKLLKEVGDAHDVTVASFDRQTNRIVTLAKSSNDKPAEASASAREQYMSNVTAMRDWLIGVAAAILIGAILFAGWFIFSSSHPQVASWMLLFGVIGLAGGTVALAAANLRYPDVEMRVALGLDDPSPPAPETDESAAPEQTTVTQVNWDEALVPQGTETRLGEAIRHFVNEERGGPLSAIIIMTDGAQNAGLDPLLAADLAQEADIPLYAIGIGSDERPRNVRISDFVAPSRAYPGDAFNVTAYVQAEGLAGRTVTVELASRDASANEGEGALEQAARVTLGTAEEVVPVRFELKSEEPSRKTYQVRIVRDASLQQDINPRDDVQEADIEIVDRESRVLLMASAATREYQFLRNQLRRDDDIVVDVYLQNARPGISQDASEILDDFPITREELFEYDAVVAFDPNWLDLSRDQRKLLESWVAEEAGGLVLVAGHIHTKVLESEDELGLVRGLYPIEFPREQRSLRDAEYGSEVALPLEFDREGSDAEFLWIEDDKTGSTAAWTTFDGVYWAYEPKEAKPGATVYASILDPTAGEMVPYMAGQLYGAGRVMYLASGEMWRLREMDDAYFEKFYTKLLRYVSQGRLLRNSTQGVLLVERDRYLLGNTVVVRAQLSDAQHDPLEAPNVVLQVTRPDSTNFTVMLQPDETRKGLFSGQFTALQEGTYRLDLPVPETIDEQLTRRIQVRVPELERENPRRNDALLADMTSRTEGLYYVGLNSAIGSGAERPLVGQLRDRTEIITLSGAPDRQFDDKLTRWLLLLLVAMLCTEWLIRRLSKLA